MMEFSTKITFRVVCAGVIWMSLMVHSAFAQDYTFSASSGTFTPLTGAIAVNGIETIGATSGNIPIGFNFTYYGAVYNTLVASSNGFISFDLSTSSNPDNFIVSPFDFTVIAPLWDQLNGTGTGQASYSTIGAVGSRVFTMEWLMWKWNAGALNAGISFQVKLYETSNKIEFVYRVEVGGALNNPSASIGIIGNTTAQFYSLANTSSAPSFDPNGNDLINAKPATGQIYTFIPGAVSSVTPTTQANSITVPTNNTGTAITLNWINGNGSYRTVFVKQTTSTSETAPVVDGEFYPPSTAFGTATAEVGSSGWYCVYNGTGNSVSVTNLVLGSTYRIFVVEYDGLNATQKYLTSTAVNNPINVVTTNAPVKLNQTITFGALANKVFGDAPFNLGATASSGLAVSYSSSNTAVATVSGSTVTIVAPGTVTITASQPGDATYNAAADVGQSFTVSKASQTITFPTLAPKVFGDAPFALTATASSSLAVTYTSSNTAVATVSGSTVTIVGAGSTNITASQPGNANYSAATDVVKTLIVSKASQTITFGALANKVYGDPAFSLAATASSGLSVTYSSSNTAVATVSGNTVTIIAPGTVTITASQAGNTNYSAATNVTQSFTVSKASQTITFGALPNKVYGDPAFSLTATASSGLSVTYSSSNTAVATVSGSTVTIVGAGSVTITASQAGNANYNAASNVSQSFTVTKASQTITFGALANKVYGDPAFSLSATASSGLSVTYSSSNTAVATVSGSTVTIVAPGTVTITASQSGNANYSAATNVTQSFTVSKASQTITFGALANKVYGNPAFNLGATASSGLSVSYSSSNTAVATVSGNTVTIVGAGSVTITASQAGNANYNAASNVTQSFTVSKASQTITFAALPDKKIGDAAFTLNATASSGLTITYSSSNTAVATVSGNTVTIVGLGTTNITASQAGNGNYNAASSVVQPLVVKTGQTITFSPIATKTLGGPVFSLSATSSAGLTVVFTSTSDKISISGNQVTILKAGSVTIKANQPGNSSVMAAPEVTQTFCINPAKPSFTTAANPTTGTPVLTSSSTSGNQWFKDGVAIAGATSATYNATVVGSGVYTVVVSVDNCSSVPSNGQNFVITDVEDFDMEAVKVFPNPTENQVVVDVSALHSRRPVSLVLYDMSGKEVFTTSSDDKVMINVGSYPAGLYLIKLQSNDRIIIKKLTKQ